MSLREDKSPLYLIQAHDTGGLREGKPPPHPSERATTLPLALRPGDSRRVVIYSQPVAVEPGDLLQVLAEVSFASEVSYTVLVGVYITLAKSEEETTGLDITEANKTNITRELHKLTRTKVGILRVSEEHAGDRHVNLVAYAASTAAKAGGAVRILRDAGRLCVLQYRKTS